ncbi:MAG TPA: dihydrodipicolinate reductase C-terminal domain-containing protein [Clostridia bacterium]|nr:dihydrodipicolinate reductase C-terminal domain-containing protein [Clostridia bacterium]
MHFVLLGTGKTGSIVEEIARERGHHVTIISEEENPNGIALTRERLAGVDAVIDFTTPHAVIGNIVAATQAGANLVVGTTGWYDQLPKVKELVERCGTGLVWASNFSIGVNLFFEIVRAASAALKYGYAGSIMERHHVHKKDAPSGTAVSLQNMVREAAGTEVEITSVREGETVGLHVLMLDSEADSILLTHDAKNRRGFAEGAVRAAEWVAGKKGFYEFKDVFGQL